MVRGSGRSRVWLLLLVACGGEAAESDCYADPNACIDLSGVHYRYVIDSIVIPTSATEAQELGLDLDGDPDARPDNALGSIFAIFASQADTPIQDAVDVNVATAQILLLVDLQTGDLDDADDAGVRLFLGADPTPAPCADEADEVCGRHLAGDASFAIDPESPDDAALAGAITDGVFTGGPGRAVIQLSIGTGAAAKPTTLNLVGARIEAIVTEDGLVDGRLGGGLTIDVIDTQLIAPLVNASIDRLLGYCSDPPFLCAPSPLVEQPCGCDLYLRACEVTRDELEDDVRSCLVASGLFRPDVDLFDADGNYAPRQDGVKDSLSLAIGFTAVTATFDPPGRP